MFDLAPSQGQHTAELFAGRDDAVINEASSYSNSMQNVSEAGSVATKLEEAFSATQPPLGMSIIPLSLRGSNTGSILVPEDIDTLDFAMFDAALALVKGVWNPHVGGR